MLDNTIKFFVNGEELEYKILFTYHHDERNADYMFIYNEENPEDVLLFQYFDDNTCEQVEDEEILAEAQELLDTYEEEKLAEVEVPEV